MFQKITRLYKEYSASRDGNFSVIMAVAMLVIVSAMAVGIDTTRLMQASSKLKSLNDMAALAATEGQNKSLEERKEIYESVMETGIQNSGEITGYEYELSFEDDGFTQVLSVTSRSEAELFFPMTRGAGKYVSALSEVTIGREFIEISLVLDISTSMKGERIIELKRSSKEFIEQMLEAEGLKGRVSIAIVPFGGTVRLPQDLEHMVISPGTTNYWVGNQWNGCLAMTSSDYTSGISPQQRVEFMPDFYAWANPWCPTPGNELMGLSMDKTALTNRIDTLSLSDGTATDIGVGWGLATLDPKWRREIDGVDNSLPRNLTTGTRKIMVVMADGGVTGQRFPRASELGGPPPYKAKNAVTTTKDAEGFYVDVCELGRTKGVEVYTVGFLITKADKLAKLHECGSTAGHNFEAGQGQLSEAFRNIAASITGLRLSR